MENLVTLVVQVQQGQTDAFEALVRRFQDMAVGYAYSLLGDIHRAEDAAQEAFIAAYFDISALRNPAAFPGWFRRIVFKHADRLRRSQQASMVSLSEESPLAASSPDPAETAETSEFQATIRTTIDTLDEHHREVVMLFYLSELSLQEISTFLEIPLGTVKSRLHTARQQLQKRMIRIMHEQLSNQRPSRNDEFANKVAQLIRATIQGNTSQVNTLLLEDQRLASANGFVGSPLWQSDAPALHVAVMHGRKEIVELLLAHGADINARDEESKFTALHQAIDLGFMADYAELGMVDFLLEHGAEKDVFAHLWLGEYDQAKALIERNPGLVNVIGPGNFPPLCYANEDMARFLLALGADAFLPLTGRLGFTTPLRWLAARNQRLFSFLLEQLGVALDVFLHCVLGQAEDVSAMIASEPDLVHARTPLDHVLEPDLTLLHVAAQYGHLAIARHLLENGADVNAFAPAVMRMTPLHLAVWRGQWQESECMPDEAEMQSSPGVLALRTDMPRLLLEHGADVAARDSSKHLTPLGWAEAKHGDEIDRSQVAALLREFGAEA